jgi:hypothetical protein
MADRKITDLTELTAPAADDLLPIVDSSEATAANKNKKIQYGTFLRNLPSGTVGAPSLAWTADTGVTGIYRSAANELAFTTNSTFAGKFSTTGFQLGTGTAAAQLHLFSSDTTDQVIIENTDAGLDTAPDVVLYRNSASPANNDNLGNIEFRGKDSGGNDHAYAQILSTIGTVTDTAEVGILDLMTADASAPAMRVRLRGSNVGISEATPLFPLHVSSTITSTALQVQATNNDSASGADITLYRRRGAATVGQNGDLLSTVYFRGHNDNATTEQVDYAAVEGSIVSVTNNSENGQLSFKVQKSGTLTTQLAITNANVILSARPILPTASPASTATGVTGEITWDNGYFYVCTATNTWKKVGISTDGIPGSTSAFSSGSAASPSITFADDTNTGIFNPAADAVGISTGGTERLRVDSTGQIEAVSLGTAAAPTYTFTTDPDTGIYSPGANQVAISTNGTGRLFVDASGRIGAGTASPSSYNANGDDLVIVNTGANAGITVATGSSFASRIYFADGTTGSETLAGFLDYNHSTDSLAFGVNASERMRLDSSGRLGLGTSSPGATLDVNGKLRLSSTEDNQLEWVTGAQTWRSNVVSGGKWYLYDVTNAKFPLDVFANTTCKLDINTSHVAFTTNNTERARIDSSGRLLVGTSTTISTVINAGLQVQGTGANAYISSGRWSADANRSELIFNKSRGASVGTRAIVQSGDGLGGIAFTGDDGTNFVTAAQISGLVDGTPGTNDMPGRLVLSTTADGASSPTEALRITNDRVIAYNQGAPAAVNATATLTVANLKTGIITSTSAAATDMTLPTGTLTEGGFSGVYTNMTFEWSVINTGPSLVRVLAGTDHTIVGSGSVATGTSGRFASRRTAANTFVAYRLS